jgi:peptidoglycan hydrolase-like protein with peptidoglycan-binding domain
MKKINEQELIARSKALREKLAEQTQADEGVGSAILNGVKNAGSAIASGAQKVLGSTAGKVGLGAAAGAGALAAGQRLAGGAAPAPAGTTAPKVPGKSDPAVLKQQQDLIAKGAKIKADGIMGPATQAAIKQFGGAAPAAAPPAGAPGAQDDVTGVDAAVAAQQAANAPQTSMDDSDDVNAREFVPPTAAAPVATNAASLKAAQDAAAGKAPAPVAGGYGAGATPAPAPAAAAPTAAQALVAKAGLPQPGASAEDMLKNVQGAMPDPAAMLAQQQARMAAMKAKTAAAAPAGAAVQGQMAAESVGFQNEELSRIMTLIHHR